MNENSPSKAAAHYPSLVAPGQSVTIKLRLTGRQADLTGQVAEALFANAEELFASAPQIHMAGLLATK